MYPQDLTSVLYSAPFWQDILHSQVVPAAIPQLCANNDNRQNMSTARYRMKRIQWTADVESFI
jgi:hypothetical protein